jgi:hypothetical protein
VVQGLHSRVLLSVHFGHPTEREQRGLNVSWQRPRAPEE